MGFKQLDVSQRNLLNENVTVLNNDLANSGISLTYSIKQKRNPYSFPLDILLMLWEIHTPFFKELNKAVIYLPHMYGHSKNSPF